MEAGSRQRTEPPDLPENWAAQQQQLHALQANMQASGAIPDIVRGLNSVAVALLSREGMLWDANRGFLMLLRNVTFGENSVEIRAVFAEPTLDELVQRRPDPVEKVIYRGVLRVRDSEGKITPLSGAVFAYDDDLLFVAEHDTAELTTLRIKLLQAGDDVSVRDREIARLERELRQATELAEAALRDRDTLLDALSSRPS